MAGGIQAAQVSGQQPAVYDGFGGHFGIVEIVGHYGFAAHRDFTDSFRARIDDFHFHAG